MKNKIRYYPVVLSLVAVLAVLTLSLNHVGFLDGATVVDREPLADGEYQEGCVDSDPLNYFNVKGVVKNKKYLYHDVCRNGVLFQSYCASSKEVKMTRGYYCPNGCEGGVCL